MLEVSTSEDNIINISIIEPRQKKDEAGLMETLQSALEKDRFGLILRVEGKASFSTEGKRELTTWFKSNKKKLKQKCCGFVRVNKDVTRMEKFKSRAMTLAMPCPYQVVESVSEAMEWFVFNH